MIVIGICQPVRIWALLQRSEAETFSMRWSWITLQIPGSSDASFYCDVSRPHRLEPRRCDDYLFQLTVITLFLYVICRCSTSGGHRPLRFSNARTHPQVGALSVLIYRGIYHRFTLHHWQEYFADSINHSIICNSAQMSQ
jgi:hypothetical protein